MTRKELKKIVNDTAHIQFVQDCLGSITHYQFDLDTLLKLINTIIKDRKKSKSNE